MRRIASASIRIDEKFRPESDRKITILYIVVCITCVIVSNESEFLRENKQGAQLRQKKRLLTIKKPIRNTERISASEQNFQRSSTSSLNEYSASVTSENPSNKWRPITYAAAFVENNLRSKKTKSVDANPDAVNIGRINHTKDIEIERTVPNLNEHVPNEQFENYALLHYYIPFEQIMTKTSKPITEETEEILNMPVSINDIMKAAVEPVAVFQLETTTTSTTPVPTTTTTTIPIPTVTNVPAFSTIISNSESKEDDQGGRYEYEYFVRDDHWGTNFGHKEYRDGKQTKGDYEVVLPDGRVQHVQYWSDASGYHASVTYHPLYRKYKHYKR
ncbi:hypothetical protein PGB90_007726 [Kerria lacca]